MPELTYALIGCGRISPNHLTAARACGLRIAALCDPVPKALGRLKKILPAGGEGIEGYGDYRELLKREKPDLVAVAAPSGLHASIALDCIRRGCHVIIEKPVALSLADARAIEKKGQAAGVTVAVCHQNRFNKAIQKVRMAIEEGKFGQLLYGTAQIRWNRGREYYAQAPWRGTWEQDGGALMNQCIHNIDLLRWLMGDGAEEVFAYTDRLIHPYIQAEDFGAALVRFRDHAFGLIEGTTAVYPRSLEETLCFFGSKGTVKIGGKSVNRLEEWRLSENTEEAQAVKEEFSEEPPNVYGYGHTPFYRDVTEAIRQGRPPYVDASDGTRALELVLAAYRSSALGRPVSLPLEEGSTLDFPDRFYSNFKKQTEK